LSSEKNTLQIGPDPDFRLEPREDTAAVIRQIHVHASEFARPGIDVAHEVSMHLAEPGGSHRQLTQTLALPLSGQIGLEALEDFRVGDPVPVPQDAGGGVEIRVGQCEAVASR
jgi:hypothetical protein